MHPFEGHPGSQQRLPGGRIIQMHYPPYTVCIEYGEAELVRQVNDLCRIALFLELPGDRQAAAVDHDWLGEQRRRDQQGRFLLAMSVFVTTALHR